MSGQEWRSSLTYCNHP